MREQGGKGLRWDDAASDGVADQAGRFMNVEFLHEPGAVRLCGFHTNAEDGGSIFGRLALGNQLKHLTLANGQKVLGRRRLGTVGFDQGPRDAWTEINLAARDLPDGIEQVAGGLVFQNVSAEQLTRTCCFKTSKKETTLRVARSRLKLARALRGLMIFLRGP